MLLDTRAAGKAYPLDGVFSDLSDDEGFLRDSRLSARLGYVGRLATALKRDGKPRPWLIYGANSYTPRIEQIVRNWSAETLGAPMIFSEFAPSGLSAQDRPHRFQWFWKVIRSRPSMVLGGVVYTWSKAGPEDLDRVFGLTDEAGQPVDDSVAAISRMFH